MTVIGNSDNSYFKVTVGKSCDVIKSFFYNGEFWYKLKDENDAVFNSPTVFWDKQKKTTKK